MEGASAGERRRHAWPVLVGRDDELQSVSRFLGGAASVPALVISGEAGIGKTTLWEAAIAQARESGRRVLIARGAEAEAKLSLTGVYDLLEPVADEVLQALPAPQRAGLEVVLLRAEPGAEPPGRRTIAVALLGALRALARGTPLLVAIDDAQWLDTATQEAAAFAARRFVDLDVLMIVAARSGSRSPLVEALKGRTEGVEVGGLSFGATRRLLAERLDLVLPHRLLRVVHDATRGNPFFALEIGRVLAARGAIGVDDPLPLPTDLAELVSGRLSALPEATRELLLAAALSVRRETPTLRVALGRAIEGDLEPAEQAGIAAVRSGTVEFTHPLHAAAAVGAATTAARRRMHRRLADAAASSEERARHLALAVEGRDESAAQTIHVAAREAYARGALTAAAELAELAVEIGEPGSAEHPSRLLDLATLLRLTGEPARSHAVLAAAAGWPDWPATLEARGRSQLLLATYSTHGATAAVGLGEQMLEEDGLADEVRAAVHAYLSGCCEFDLDRAAAHGDAALRLLEAMPGDADPGVLAHALALRVRNRVLLGHGLDAAPLARVAELEARLPPERRAAEAMSGYLALLHKHVDDLETSRDSLTRLLENGVAEGNDVTEMIAGMHLALTELWAGDLRAAQKQVDLVAARVHDHGTRNVFLEAVRALVAAHRGDEETVRAVAAALEAEHGEPGVEGYGIYLRAAEGRVELSLGRDAAADRIFRRALEVIEAGGHREPGIFRVHANAGEAAVAVGDLERAAQIAAFLADHADRTGHGWSLASSERVRALIAATGGDLDAARVHAARAVDVYARLGMQLEHARAVLIEGVVERRARRRGRARTLLATAAEELDDLGARAWADRARSELARVSGRARLSPGELTSAERRVAELAAAGLANKEIARRLFVTVHTVELHLSHAYAKLGVHSRGQLAGHMSMTPAKD